jgi:hypothetical protein
MLLSCRDGLQMLVLHEACRMGAWLLQLRGQRVSCILTCSTPLPKQMALHTLHTLHSCTHCTAAHTVSWRCYDTVLC